MFFFYFDTENIKIELGSFPRENDLAIVSIDQFGNLGDLNGYVLKEYGYSDQILKELDLKKGYDLFQLNNKPILFIVTIKNDLIGEKDNTKHNLRTNLSKAIDTHFDFFRSRSIWIPLMGTGSGGLTVNESFDSIINILKLRLLKIEEYNCTFNISIPDNNEGLKLYNNIVENNNSTTVENTSKEKLIKNIQDFKANYYLVGSTWDNEEQADRFYNESIWENGYEDGKYSNIINEAKINDILIHKSTFSNRKGQSILRIKAFGIVEGKSEDGRTLKVDWIVKFDSNLDVIGLGFFRDTISRLDNDSLNTILDSFGSDSLKFIYDIINNYFVNNNSFASNSKISTKLAGLIADVESGEDHLDIKKDVNAFARVIAAKSFDPPLAIALLGKWGSGKSFFMRKLKDSIQDLSVINPENQFCEGIAHVHFNAWSYMDANLWASIITRILESLDDYIKNTFATEKEIKIVENQLFSKLNISKDEIFSLENQTKLINTQLFGLYRQKINTKLELKKKVATIKQNTLEKILKNVNEKFKVEDIINKAVTENPTFINSANELEKIIPKKYWVSPEELYNQSRSKYTLIKSFFKKGTWLRNTIWLIVILLIIFLTPIFTYIVALLASWQDFSFTAKTLSLILVFGNFWKRAVDTYNKISPLIASFWNIKEDYELARKEALFTFNQREKALNIEIINSKEEINRIDKQIIHNKEIKERIEFKLKSALSTEALYTFIEKRANSDDYKKHLGIVSLIRKDIEILSGLLTGHQTELVSNKESQEFKDLFGDKKPLERIILYIDDLDRCPEERVVEVLEAVNLLMAFPLFIVVVGVDPRWVKTALQKKYKNQFTEDKENEDAISPSNYLEKIFQIPFYLKDAENESIKSMIKTLAQIKPNLVITQPKGDFDSNDFDSNDFNTRNIKKQVTEEKNQELTKSISSNSNLLNKETIEALDITEKECELMQDMSEIIGNNPRAIKRFVNIYRIVKTHEDFGFSNEETKDPENGLILLILALSMGNFKELMKSFEVFISRKYAMNNENLRSYLKSEYVDKVDKDKDGYHNIRKDIYHLLNKKNPEILDQPFSTIFEHYQFIKRFTFKNI